MMAPKLLQLILMGDVNGCLKLYGNTANSYGENCSQ